MWSQKNMFFGLPVPHDGEIEKLTRPKIFFTVILQLLI